MSFLFSAEIADTNWGCSFSELDVATTHPQIKICFVRVSDLVAFANELIHLVHDNSWMAKLDKGVQRQYDFTVKETAAILIDIFRHTVGVGKIAADFGELMVSVGSARALEKVLGHIKVPLAELWKPQAKQNEGFDFHTTCTGDLINFGEAKYSAKSNPHGLAITQVGEFLAAEKHLRDRAHLVNLVNPVSIDNLDQDRFGVVAAFSVNSSNPIQILKNAAQSAENLMKNKKLSGLYLVGVADEC
ncbi:hypothetical protein B0920_16235 [Massilia sp. KIM]|uniref:hypothetical protein n=1 Tax=Massilia sp. KIM TaxID=1955422 RepID=UPI00098F9382|nr:hypothetical protein [Massilia sp. KIM]OON60529.1 hypothetical protein B0920_16235 [Massilia sp. KIM]